MFCNSNFIALIAVYKGMILFKSNSSLNLSFPNKLINLSLISFSFVPFPNKIISSILSKFLLIFLIFFQLNN